MKYNISNIIKNNDIKKIKLIKKSNYKLLISKDKFNVYPLQYAFIFNKLLIVKYLLNNGAKLNIIDTDNKLIIYILFKYNLINIIIYIIKYDKNIHSYIDNDGNTILTYAIMFNKKNIIKILLNNNNININIKDKFGNNIIYYIFKYNHYNLIKIFLQYDVDINNPNNEGMTALHYFFLNNNNLYYLKKILFFKNLDINIQSYKYNFSYLHCSIIMTNINICIYIINNIKNYDINLVDNEGKTITFYCISIFFKYFNNNKEHQFLNTIIKLYNLIIIHPMFNINIYDINDQNLFHYTYYFYPSIRLFFIKNYIINKLNLNYQDIFGNTILHYIVKYDDWQNTFYDSIFNKNINIFIKNKNNESVYDFIYNKYYYNNIKIFNSFINIIINNYIYILKHNNDKYILDNVDNYCINNINNKKYFYKCVRLIKNKIINEKTSIIIKKKNNINININIKNS